MRVRRPAPAARDRARPSEERSLTDPRFVGSFPSADVPLDPPLPEIVLLGRSNVGKSSLINALVGRRIAKVSRTPGKTRALNVYEIDLGRREKREVPRGASGPGGPHRHVPPPSPFSLYLLDLPGYGYARAGKGERETFRHLIRHTLDRPRLAGVVWLLDIRHEPSADDHTTQDVLAARGTRVLAAVTKSDKLPRGRRLRRERELREGVGLAEDQLIVTSARTSEGIAELREAIAELVKGTVT